jgi:hypothetical protein
MSAIPRKRPNRAHIANGAKGQKATKYAAANEVLFDYLVGGRNQRRRHNYAKGFGGR